MDDWKKAGQIANQALEYGSSLIVKGARAVDVLDRIEAKIIELGGGIAFPAQVSCNHVAAHWCADHEDPFIFNDELVCLDVGAHVNGCIGDNACTIDLSGRYSELVAASREALNAAIATAKPGATLSQIGRAIEDAIKKRGFTPIHNLSGHCLDVYQVHTSPSIPNYDTGQEIKLEKGQIIAIEPFATDGAGMIYETDRANLFSMVHKRPVRSPIARDLLKVIERYNGLPFTTRWLVKHMPLVKVNYGLRELLAAGVLRKYPPLPDKNKGMVSQAEHTVLIEDEPVILTRGKIY